MTALPDNWSTWLGRDGSVHTHVAAVHTDALGRFSSVTYEPPNTTRPMVIGGGKWANAYRAELEKIKVLAQCAYERSEADRLEIEALHDETARLRRKIKRLRRA